VALFTVRNEKGLHLIIASSLPAFHAVGERFDILIPHAIVFFSLTGRSCFLGSSTVENYLLILGKCRKLFQELGKRDSHFEAKGPEFRITFITTDEEGTAGFNFIMVNPRFCRGTPRV
jgi:hypothetical protein